MKYTNLFSPFADGKPRWQILKYFDVAYIVDSYGTGKAAPPWSTFTCATEIKPNHGNMSQPFCDASVDSVLKDLRLPKQLRSLIGS